MGLNGIDPALCDTENADLVTFVCYGWTVTRCPNSFLETQKPACSHSGMVIMLSVPGSTKNSPSLKIAMSKGECSSPCVLHSHGPLFGELAKLESEWNTTCPLDPPRRLDRRVLMVDRRLPSSFIAIADRSSMRSSSVILVPGTASVIRW